MKTYLFFDTESTGLIDFKLDLMDESQPRIVQLAALLIGHGIPMRDILTRFNSLKGQCSARVAFNIDFDKRLLAREAHICGIEHDSDGLESHCVMRMAKPICKLPPTDKMMATGRKDFKPPKLEEAYQHFFGKSMDGAHDAMNDVKATAAIFFAILAAQNEPAALEARES
jgi:DNA polymerase-3 subunit epsilon